MLIWADFRVNPLTFGLGDLRSSASAQAVRGLGETARADNSWIASDSPYVSALLVANGAPSLTGYQTSGPNDHAWERLDPARSYEDQWNRGASFLRMTFSGPTAMPAIVRNPSPDVIEVSVDPCVLAESGLRVAFLVTEQKLSRTCVREIDRFVWSGRIQHVYALLGDSS
jgi:hypothetical protein